MKKRADIRLSESGLCESLAQAQRLIMAGKVRIGSDRLIHKANEMVDADAQLSVEKPYPYVSRGAEKLLPALDKFAPDLKNAIALDIGASTGGFTDLMLQRGAAKVYAVDVGYGQLDNRLRSDRRVVSMEKVNARNLPSEQISEPIDLITADVSFISLRKVIPPADPILKSGGLAFLLVKPQFEARRREVGRGGVIRDSTVRQRCIDEICEFMTAKLGWQCLDVIPSPISGPKGNREFITVFRKPE
ncbi:MAG: TlyA family RNA methyltransferase [Lentisphaeria bacterium]